MATVRADTRPFHQSRVSRQVWTYRRAEKRYSGPRFPGVVTRVMGRSRDRGWVKGSRPAGQTFSTPEVPVSSKVKMRQFSAAGTKPRVVREAPFSSFSHWAKPGP